MKFFAVRPEVAGGLGEQTVIDRSFGKMDVLKLHYQFDGWLGDDILESDPCFIVSERLAQAIERERLTGVQFDDVEITKSELFMDLHPDRQLPNFVWLKVEGTAGRDDFGISPDLLLVVSERAIALLKKFRFSNVASITPFERN